MIFAIIFISYFVLGIIASILFITRQYRENSVVDSDDIRVAFILFIAGVFGLLIFIGCRIALWVEKNQPVETLFKFVSKKITNMFDKISRNDINASK